MNVFLLVLPALILYFLGYRFYSRKLAKSFGESDRRSTPAHQFKDGVDYVPTRPHVLFAHHFSAIAAAGPILGPTMALLYGYAPAFFWIVFGAILIGAVHDYACLYVSVREDGKSIVDVSRKLLGKNAFIAFALFVAFNLVLVNAVFINLTAVSLTSLRSLADLGLPSTQTLFKTIIGPSGAQMALVGGIASSSAIVLTLIAPILGFYVVKRNMPNKRAYPLATLLCVFSVLIGFLYPVALPSVSFFGWTIDPVNFWVLLISIYVLIAASTPVWLILQPREFVSVQFLYLGILLLVVAALACGIKGIHLQAPAAAIDQGEKILGFVWPSLFITIACGAVSGFHGLVASGTTAKQIDRESHCRSVGYLGMLGESALALCVTIAIAVGVSYAEYTSFLVKPENALTTWKANPVLAFSFFLFFICEAGLGIPRWLGLVFGLLMVEGFVLDTLDVSIRLNRYLFEEVWSVMFKKTPKLMRNKYFNSGISVVLMLLLAFGNSAQTLWPIFGSGNQLLAALSLLIISILLLKNQLQLTK